MLKFSPMWCIQNYKDDLLQIKIETKSTPNWNNIDSKATPKPKPKRIQSCAPSLVGIRFRTFLLSGLYYKDWKCNFRDEFGDLWNHLWIIIHLQSTIRNIFRTSFWDLRRWSPKSSPNSSLNSSPKLHLQAFVVFQVTSFVFKSLRNFFY